MTTTATNVGTSDRTALIFAGLLPTVLGGSALWASVTGTGLGGLAVQIVLGILGLVFLAIGLGLWYWMLFRWTKTWLTVSDEGLGLVRGATASDKPTWTLAWAAIREVRISHRRAFLADRGAPGGRRGPAFALMFPRDTLAIRCHDHDTAARINGPIDPSEHVPAGVVRVDLGTLPWITKRVRRALGARLSVDS